MELPRAEVRSLIENHISTIPPVVSSVVQPSLFYGPKHFDLIMKDDVIVLVVETKRGREGNLQNLVMLYDQAQKMVTHDSTETVFVDRQRRAKLAASTSSHSAPSPPWSLQVVVCDMDSVPCVCEMLPSSLCVLNSELVWKLGLDAKFKKEIKKVCHRDKYRVAPRGIFTFVPFQRGIAIGTASRQGAISELSVSSDTMQFHHIAPLDSDAWVPDHIKPAQSISRSHGSESSSLEDAILI
ncbi:hypothetical protein FXO38_21737 [Capsicum annuum]|nr:hypothetical protein FXO38_21737 [Capsicum annuum]